MTQYCPEWIFGICSAATAKEFLSSENSLNSVSRKFAQGLSEKFTEIKLELVLILTLYQYLIGIYLIKVVFIAQCKVKFTEL